MATTYTPIATTTASGAATVTFSSIPNTYTDLVLIYTATASSGTPDMTMRLNNDTAGNYSGTWLSGNGTSATSARDASSRTYMYLDSVSGISTTSANVSIVNIMNYANTTTYKTVLARSSNANNGVDAFVNLWRATPAAINRIDLELTAGNVSGTFTLYGIKAA